MRHVGGDATVRRDQNRLFWNAHWVGTHAPIDGVLRDGLGGATNLGFNRKYFAFNTHYDYFSPSFRNSDLGFFFGRPNKNDVNVNVNLMQPDPHGIVRTTFVNIYAGHDWTTDEGLNLSKWFGFFSNLQYKSFWRTYFSVQRNLSAFDDLDTRGGPPIVRPANTFFNTGVNSDSRKQYGFGMRVTGDRDELAAAWIVYRARGSVPGLVAPEWIARGGIHVGPRQRAVDQEHRYRRRWQRRPCLRPAAPAHVNITGRTTYSFTRDMTLEAYLQPFVAVGDYSNIGRLARPKSFEFAPVTLDDNPDFNRKSVRGTVVLRWEYVRGSTLFAVWNVWRHPMRTRGRASFRRCAIWAARLARLAPTPSPSNSSYWFAP